MRVIKAEEIEKKLIDAIQKACISLDDKMLECLRGARQDEGGNAAFVLDSLIENAGVAKEMKYPLCQDTGMAVFFVKQGSEVFVEGNLTKIINECTEKAYRDNNFRNSVVHPISRKYDGYNIPAVIHQQSVDGDSLEITFMPKGFGSENMTALRMLAPAEGVDGITDFVVDAVKKAGSCPCPPIVVGVGIGGTADKALELSKVALLRDLGTQNSDLTLDKLEKQLLQSINELGIGAGGFGGHTTAVAVHIEVFPTHIAGLPVAVSLQCNALRKERIFI